MACRGTDFLPAIAFRRLDRVGRGERGGTNAVDAERAEVVARVVVRGQVPAARVDDQAERAQLASCLLA